MYGSIIHEYVTSLAVLCNDYEFNSTTVDPFDRSKKWRNLAVAGFHF